MKTNYGKSIVGALSHIVWCLECNHKFSDIHIHMIKELKEQCQYCKRTNHGLCKKHMKEVYGD